MYLKLPSLKVNPLFYIMVVSLTCWLILLISSLSIQNGPEKLSILAAKIEIVVHIITLAYLFQISTKIHADDRKAIIWLFAINFWLLFVDASFYIVIYASKTYLLQLSIIQFILYFAPCMIYCITMIIFLSRILLRNVLLKRDFLKIIAALFTITIITFSLFLSAIHNSFNFKDWRNIAQIGMLLVEFILFDFSILGLIFANNSSVILLLSGTIILITGDYLITYSSITQTTSLFPFGEFLWLLGLLFILFSVVSIKQNKHYSVKNWFRKSNMIKSKLAFWVFSISISSFLLFFIITFVFSIMNRAVFVDLPLFIMLYSIIIVTLAIIMGKTFEIPFKKIEKNIRALMNNNDKDSISDDFSIEEFLFLQKFILEMFKTVEERDRVKKELGTVTAQVAHDIRSPIASILMLATACEELPEEPRIALREAADRIQDIANNLLSQYQGSGGKYQNSIGPRLLSTAILSILSEKKLQNIQFDIHISQAAYFSFVNINLVEFKRVISNLINNAIEAMSETNKIFIDMTSESGIVTIQIADTGTGMSNEIIEKLMSKKAYTEKKNGSGLGISHALNVIEQMNGKLSIASKVNCGTTVTISLPELKKPAWIADVIKIKKGDLIIILDDEKSIHGAWDAKLDSYLNLAEASVKHFERPLECIEFINNLACRENILLLVDYEFLKDKINGLEVVKSTGIKRSILVTSHFQESIVLKCQQLNSKLLPKSLTSQVPIEIDKQLINIPKNLEGILVDDDQNYLRSFLYLANTKEKEFLVFNDSYSLFEIIDQIPKNTKIYLDYDLGSSISGIDLSYILYGKGYTELYLVSGYSSDYFEKPETIKMIIEKSDILI